MLHDSCTVCPSSDRCHLPHLHADSIVGSCSLDDFLSLHPLIRVCKNYHFSGLTTCTDAGKKYPCLASASVEQ